MSAAPQSQPAWLDGIMLWRVTLDTFLMDCRRFESAHFFCCFRERSLNDFVKQPELTLAKQVWSFYHDTQLRVVGLRLPNCVGLSWWIWGRKERCCDELVATFDAFAFHHERPSRWLHKSVSNGHFAVVGIDIDTVTTLTVLFYQIAEKSRARHTRGQTVKKNNTAAA